MNLQHLMKQAQKMQKEMQKKQDELNNKTFDFEYHNGLVKISITGKLEIKNLTISKDLVDPDDCETLEDLIRNSVNESIEKINNEKEALMPKVPGQM